MKSMSQALVDGMQWLADAAGFVVLGLCLLLFIQWPLRDWIHAYSQQANDAGQILFAVYTAVAITAASRARSHLANVTLPEKSGVLSGAWRDKALLLCVGPWALFLLWTATPQMLASLRQLESFSEGNTPGYFMLRIALVFLGILVLIEALHRALARPLQT